MAAVGFVLPEAGRRARPALEDLCCLCRGVSRPYIITPQYATVFPP